MNIQQLLATKDWDTIIDYLTDDVMVGRTPAQKNIAYYNNCHNILKDPERQDEWPEGSDDPIRRSRDIFPFPRQIVKSKLGMVAGKPPTLVLNGEKDDTKNELFGNLQRVFDQELKGGDMFFNMVEYLSVETKSAIILSYDEQFRQITLNYEDNKDRFYPFFNDSRVMEALTHYYMTDVVIDGKVEQQEVVVIYTKDYIYKKEGDNEIEEIPNKYKKIQAIYFDQQYSEWHWVQSLIDKFEKVESQHSDNNKRLGDTAIVAKGEISELPKSGDTKVYQVQQGTGADGNFHDGDIKLLEANGASTNIKDEMDRLQKSIYKFTWEDLSKLFDMEGTGSISTETMKLKFVPLLVNVAAAEVVLKTGMLRLINVLKQMMEVELNEKYTELDVSVQFNSILPDSLSEQIDNLADAVSAGITSQQQAVSLCDLNKGSEEQVYQQILSEQQGQIQLEDTD